MAKKITSQSYPRINNELDKYHGYLDVSLLVDHKVKIDSVKLKEVIEEAIIYANKKSGREILSIPIGISDKELSELLRTKGKELFEYFVKYCGDPPSTAYDCLNQSYEVVARESFRLRTIQKERMNAGWRYQFIAKDAAILSKRFESISDINSSESDFNAIIKYKDTNDKLSIYISVKNRSNTMGGQDWPKAIAALENAAITDKNRNGYYICVFGIAMERGLRNIKSNQKTKNPYSSNTEVWYSDFFWPFFSNHSYDEIAKAVLDVLIENAQLSGLEIVVPQEVIDSFGNQCRNYNLIDENGKFNDAHKLVDLFCGKLKKK